MHALSCCGLWYWNELIMNTIQYSTCIAFIDVISDKFAEIWRTHLYPFCEDTIMWESVNEKVLTNQIDIWSEKTHEVTRCKQALSHCFFYRELNISEFELMNKWLSWKRKQLLVTVWWTLELNLWMNSLNLSEWLHNIKLSWLWVMQYFNKIGYIAYKTYSKSFLNLVGWPPRKWSETFQFQ